ncbi:unnamed protein product [Lupinus luteus]|uniref:Uncharacterized protein n=1 Tax=Lupinus luteus TaxID=3873 RepID=A0AAV1XAK6_LUPLU
MDSVDNGWIQIHQLYPWIHPFGWISNPSKKNKNKNIFSQKMHANPTLLFIPNMQKSFKPFMIVISYF